ncbi:MAG TPA: hypothetical protein VJT67_05145 [Longimicrobiaceae bacterium]|nr:hypothetical protein [Longimicrobiaceae bacterium]
MPRSRIQQMERVLTFAARFLEEVREDIHRCKMDGSDTPPRIRSVHERPGHATPEFRTLTIPIPDGYGGLSPEVLSGAIAKFAAGKRPDCLLLALEAENGDGPLLIAEARCRYGTRLFWMQPFTWRASKLEWGEPLDGGWQDPDGEEMILDAAFTGARTVAAGA